MTTNTNAKLEIGDPTDSGYSLKIVNGFNNGSDKFVRNYVVYTFHGVDDVDIQDPYNTGAARNSDIAIQFSEGGKEHVEGVITEIFNTDSSDE